MDTTDSLLMCKPLVDTKNIMVNRELQLQLSALPSQSPMARSTAYMLATPTKRADETWCQVSDESFLEMERQCNFDTTIKCANTRDDSSTFEETQLFDVDPPSEFWDQTIPSNRITPDNSQEMAPAIWRPSTIIEETSSQMSSMNKGDSVSSTSASSSISAPAATKPNTSSTDNADGDHKKTLSYSTNSTNSTNSSGSFKSATDHFSDSLRVTKRKYKFFEDAENDSTPIASHRRPNQPASVSNRRFFNKSNSNSPLLRTDVKTPVTVRKIYDRTSSEKKYTSDTPRRNNNQFNDTLEAIDFFIEEGKRCEDAKNNTTIAPTPLFSCKRTRLLNDMAAVEMASFSRRGPLIDLMASPNSDKNPLVKNTNQQ